MKVITVANQKGGIGKTTTVLCLGAHLEQKGYKVLYIDLDAQNDTSRTLRADTDAKGSYEMLADRIPASELIQVTENGHHVISASNRLANINTELNKPKNEKDKELILKASLKGVADRYDFAVIDTARDLNTASMNALACTDYLVISTMAEEFSKTGIETLLNVAGVIKKHTNSGLNVAGILLTRYNDRSIINRAFKEEISQLASEYNTKVFNTYIRENVSIRECQALKEPITTYAPKSNANADYLAFTEELLKEIKG